MYRPELSTGRIEWRLKLSLSVRLPCLPCLPVSLAGGRESGGSRDKCGGGGRGGAEGGGGAGDMTALVQLLAGAYSKVLEVPKYKGGI